jgi:hypothetical protein
VAKQEAEHDFHMHTSRALIDEAKHLVRAVDERIVDQGRADHSEGLGR